VFCIALLAGSAAVAQQDQTSSTGTGKAGNGKPREATLKELLEAGPGELPSSTTSTYTFAPREPAGQKPESATSLGPETEPLKLPDIGEFEQYLQSKNRRKISIGLNEVVLRTLAKNLNIKIQDLANRSAHDEFHAQEGIFDLRIGGSVSVDRTDSPIPYKEGAPEGQPDSSKQRTYNGQASVGQLLPSGGLLELIFDESRVDNNTPLYYSPYYSSGAGVQMSHPLLRNAGPFVTQSGIVLAQYSNLITSEAYRLQVFNELAKSITTYYELVFAASNVEVLRISLAQADELLRVNTAKFKAGVLPELDVLQAQADVAARQELLITAVQSVEDVSDQLKNQLAEICELRDVAVTPLDVPQVPDYDFKNQEERFIRDAVVNRPEFEQVRLQIEQADIRRVVAHNQTLPQLDLFARYLAAGIDNTHSGSIDNTRDNDHSNWRVGVQFSYPLQNRAARYRFHQAEKALETAALQMEKVQHDIVKDVRTSIRAVETNRQKIEVGKATVEFNKQKVDTGQKRQNVGLATSFEVLKFQSDLANARSNLLRAVIDYNKAIVELERAKGTLLGRLGIKVEGGEKSPGKRIPEKPFGESN
jgi:outer membrane protein TolC